MTPDLEISDIVGGNQDYADRVADELAVWLRAGTSGSSRVFERLARTLRCPFTDEYAENISQEDMTCNEAIVRSAWITVFEQHEHGSIMSTWLERHILTGLFQHGRWRTLMESGITAHAFAGMLLRYMEDPPAYGFLRSVGDRDAFIRAQAHSDMAYWLHPLSTSETLTVRELALALFGDAWVTLVFDALPPGTKPSVVIEREHPPFLPGRLNLITAPELEELPSMGN